MMDAVLHIEPINRSIPAPITVGHKDFVFYGEKLTEDDENIGSPSSSVLLGCPFNPSYSKSDFRVGCPLESLDVGSTQTSIPVIKTIEYAPDYTRPKGHVYTETLHYLKDNKHLIPFRSKIRTGLGQNSRITHLPSLNAIRHDITGHRETIKDPRSEIVADLLLRDQSFLRRNNYPLRDWINTELIGELDRTPVNELSFHTGKITSVIHRYINQVRSTSSELSTESLNTIRSVINPENKITPPVYFSKNAISKTLGDFREASINHGFDFSSLGRIPIERVERVEYNPFSFQDICDLIDRIPITDFNVDFVFGMEGNIEFYHEHIAFDRFSVFADNDLNLYPPGTIIKDYFDAFTLNEIIEKFITAHSGITNDIAEILDYEPVKIKIIKTITDEAAILLYRYNGTNHEPPLCGVYFDIAIQSLAPLSIIQEPLFS